MPEGVEILAMMIPAAEGERHAARAGLDEAASREEVLHQFRSAVIAVLRISFAVTGAHLRYII